jgi:tRNA (guanine10-N2)-dimethyltransferase
MKHGSLFILGRQPAIGLAELESLYGADALEPLGERAVSCNMPTGDVRFARLGGSVRLAKPVLSLNTVKWPEVVDGVAAALAGIIATLPDEGKAKLGLSVFGLSVRPKQLFAAGLELKKTFKQTGRSVRLAPNTELELSSAQVLHNQLASALGVELLLIKYGNKTVVAQTVAVQDINAYAKRDQQRPKRDARVGMLPPKLAQIIVNLAVNGQESTVRSRPTVLDPFCGTGVVLQEALLMGFGAYGTDLEPRMIDYSQANLDWLKKTYTPDPTPYTLEVGDATNHQWQHPFAAVACETYLGRPLSSWPKPETLQDIIGTCNIIIEKFLRNIHGQMQPGTRLCLAVPCWQSPDKHFYHLPLLDRLEEIRYNRVSFEHAATKELIYYRPGQTVARELLVITRK